MGDMTCEICRDAKTVSFYAEIRELETGDLVFRGPRRRAPSSAKTAACLLLVAELKGRLNNLFHLIQAVGL